MKGESITGIRLKQEKRREQACMAYEGFRYVLMKDLGQSITAA
jgi:hypothetical protein